MAKDVDPVCKMELDPGQIVAQSRYQDHVYNFCSVECKQNFDKNPEQYITASSGNHAQDSSPIPL